MTNYQTAAIVGAIFTATAIVVGASWWLAQPPQVARCFYPGLSDLSLVEVMNVQNRYGCR